MSEETAALWDRCQRGDRQARNALIEEHMILVRQVAGAMIKRLPHHVAQEDLESYGAIGLIQAVDNFDPSKGVPFSNYAVTNIWGRVLDELRREDWAPKSLRKKARELEQAANQLTDDLGRAPTDEELGMAVDKDADYVRQTRLAVRNSTFRSVQEPDHGTEDSYLELVDEGPTPEESANLAVYYKFLGQWLRELDDEGQVILALYYYQGMTLAEVAHHTGISEVKVTQTHTKMVMELREALIDHIAHQG